MAKARVVAVREETPEEKALREWYAQQALASPGNLEAAARTIVGLVTGLLGLLLGVLAVDEDPLPSYLWDAGMRPLGVTAIVCLLVALTCALLVLLPRRIEVSSHRPDRQETSFKRMRAWKAWWLRGTVLAFGLGLGLLGAVLIAALLTVV
jgi:hypothetical protein